MCNICLATKKKQRRRVGRRPRGWSSSRSLRQLRKRRGEILTPATAAFPSAHPLRTPGTGSRGKRERRQGRDGENPRPFTGLPVVAAVSYLGLRGAPLYRRTATLVSPPHHLLRLHLLVFRAGSPPRCPFCVYLATFLYRQLPSV